MSGPVEGKLEDNHAKADIVEIARYLVNCGERPDLRIVSNMLEDFGKAAYRRGYEAKHSRDVERE